MKEWTNCGISGKAEWEGLDYLLTDINPDEVEDETLADFIRIGKVAYENIRRIVNEMSEECVGEDCPMCKEEEVERAREEAEEELVESDDPDDDLDLNELDEEADDEDDECCDGEGCEECIDLDDDELGGEG